MIVFDIEITVKQSKRKTASIYIERDGTITALMPDSLSEDEIREIILGQEYQIHRHLAEWQEANGTKVFREFVNGQSFLYLGRNYQLSIVNDEDETSLILKNGKFLLPKSLLDKAEQCFIQFYKEKLQQRLPEIIQEYETQMGLTHNQMRIMELQNRWASCSDKGNLNFHWKCGMAPLSVLNYIVVHELAHLRYPNHTTEFWNEVDKVLPRYRENLEWLKVNGASMDL